MLIICCFHSDVIDLRENSRKKNAEDWNVFVALKCDFWWSNNSRYDNKSNRDILLFEEL